MHRLSKLALAIVAPVVVYLVLVVHARAEFPGDTTVEGAYARIVLAITEGHPRDCFAYLETRAQWACYTIGDYRKKASGLIAKSYPEPEKSSALSAYRAEAADGADVWEALAESHGWIARLRQDLSGIAKLELADERATLETAHGTRYTFRRRENGIWGLTRFTGDLVAGAEKAARDLEMVERAAADYDRATNAP
jgi:hypothetical protein